LPAFLKEQLNQLEEFWTRTENSRRREKPIRPKTYRTYKNHILSFLGWLTRARATNLKDIKLEDLTNQGLLSDFIAWGLEQRGNSHGWALNVAQSAMLIATWQHAGVQTNPSQDLPAVAQLRNYISILRRQYSGELETKKGERARLAEDACELTDELRQKISAYLRQDCTEVDSAGKERSEIALLRSWQRYLITSILLFCPIRLQTLCQLELARSLLRESDGSWVIVTETQHKTGYSGIPVKLHLPQLKDDLTTWIEEWRPRIKTENNFAFTKLGSNRLPEALGLPLTERDAWELVARATEKATVAILGTPVRINPSMLRRSHISLVPERLSACDRDLSSSQKNSKHISVTWPCTSLKTSIQQQDTKQVAKFFKDLGIALDNYNPDSQTLTNLIQQIEHLSASKSLRVVKHLEAILHIFGKETPAE
jgi:hypothetical protein